MLRRVTMTNGSHLYINPDHVMFVGEAVKDGVPLVGQSVVKLIDAMIAVEGSPDDVSLLLSGE